MWFQSSEIHSTLEPVSQHSQLKLEPTELHLFVVADKDSGCIAVYSGETLQTTKNLNSISDENINEQQYEFSNFLIRLQPKLILVPDITNASDLKIISSVLVRCPSPNIVNGSFVQLLTIHSDGLLRVWNLDDGRCILVSNKTLLQSKPLGMTELNDYPGFVVIVGSDAELYIVNYYTMELKNQVNLGFNGLQSIKATGGQIEIIDSLGNQVNVTDQNYAKNSSLQLKNWVQFQMNNYLKLGQKQINFKYTLSSSGSDSYQSIERDIRRIKSIQKLLVVHNGDEGCVKVFQDVIQVQLYQNGAKKMSLIEFTEKDYLLQAFVSGKRLFTISNNLILEVYNLSDLLTDHKPTDEQLEVQRVKLINSIHQINLINVKVCDYQGVIKQLNWRAIQSEYQTQQEEVRFKLSQLKPTSIQYNSKFQFLFTVIGKTMLTWNLKNTIEYLGKAILCVTNIDPIKNNNQLTQLNTGCLISINSILQNFCYRPNQFRFFYSGESVTTCLTYEEKYIFGTNEGRVFQVPLFQEDDGKVQPCQLLAHHQSSISNIYIAGSQFSQFVISCSNKQLMCTQSENLKSKQPMRSADPKKLRIDAIVQSRLTKRRRSIGIVPNCDNYFYYEVKKPISQADINKPRQIFKLQTLGMVASYLRGEESDEIWQYYCVIGDKEITLVYKDFKTIINIKQLDVEVKTVLHDVQFQCLLIVDIDLNVITYNLRSRILGSRKRTPVDLFRILRVDMFAEKMIKKECNYFLNQPKLDKNFTSFDHYEENLMSDKINRGRGGHRVLDFQMMNLKRPLIYSPQPTIFDGYTIALDTVVQNKDDILFYKKTEIEAKNLLNLCLDLINDLDLRLQSDQIQSTGVTNQRAYICKNEQSVMILNVKDMKNTMQQQLIRQRHNSAFESEQGSNDIKNREEQKNIMASELRLNTDTSYFAAKWPAQMFSLFHPFNLSEQLDSSLKEYFDLSLPFLNFKLGIQGAHKSMSFCISEEDQQYNREKDNLSKTIALLKLSKQVKLSQRNFTTQEIMENDVNLFLRRFFNSEYWRISSYQSTILPLIFFSCLVNLASLEETDINILMQDWLYQVQNIQLASAFQCNALSVLPPTKQFSFSSLSFLLLNQDIDISAAAKDLILRPLICRNSLEVSKGSSIGYSMMYKQILDWQIIIQETYDQMQTQSQTVPNNNSQSKISQQLASQIKEKEIVQRYKSINLKPEEVANLKQDQDLQSQQNKIEPNQNQNLSNLFGDLQIAAILSLSFFSNYTYNCSNQSVRGQKLSQKILDRCGKLVVILIRDIIQQFKNAPEQVNLLTAMMWPLQFGLKISAENFKNQQIMEDVVKYLLFIFNYYKPQIKREKTFKEVIVDNYHLMRPYNLETFLKFQANEKLLKLGAAFTDKFLDLIKVHAISLQDGTEHQRNVLETLRYFISGYSQFLEKHLIKIVQILLRCLDPNDLSLRKNSHKYVGVILSNLVKLFPMVAFHSETQRLAVGTTEGPIGIYDVRTSAKIETFIGHLNSVKCLAFDKKGKWLVSYSAGDLSLMLWKVGDSSFFSQLMGGNNRVANQIQLQPLIQNRPQTTRSSHKQGQLLNLNDGISGQLNLLEPDQTVDDFDESESESVKLTRCKVIFKEDDQKIVELTREDRSKEYHKIIR